MEDSANLQPSSPRIYAKERTTSSTTAIWSCTWNWDCVSSTSIVFSRLIKHHGWKTTYTSTLINIQLRKMILKKISLRWCTTRSLVSVTYVHLFFYMTYSFHVKFFFVYNYLFLCIHRFIGKVYSLWLFVFMYWFIHCSWNFCLYVYLFLYIDSFIAGKVFFFMFLFSCVFIDFLFSCVFIDFFYVSLFICIDSFIVGKVFVFTIVCSYVLIHPLYLKFLSFWLFVLMYLTQSM